MSTKIPISKLGSLIAEKTGCDSSDAVQFIKDLFIIVEDRVSKGEEITISGLGTFSKSAIAGEPIAYCPDKEYAAELNDDFASFSPVALPPELPDEELSAIGTEQTPPATIEKQQETSDADKPSDTDAADAPSDLIKAQPESEPAPEITLPEDSPFADEPASELQPLETAEVTLVSEGPDATISAAESTEPATVSEPNGLEEKTEKQPACDSTEVISVAPTVDLSASGKEQEETPEKEKTGSNTACIPEVAEEYVIVRKKKNYFWLGMLLGLLLGFALGMMALFAYLVQNMKISFEDLIF